jgi:putative DNA primase/helicase
MNSYNDGARAFWLEAYGGRPYSVDRMKHPQPILVPHLVVAWQGGIQPARLAQVMREADDGLLARFCWFWPDPVPFKIASAAADVDFAVGAFDRLRMLEMAAPLEPGQPHRPMIVPLSEGSRPLIEQFGRQMQERQEAAGGLLVSSLGKARGLALRLSLVLEFLWWAAKPGFAAPPTQISDAAFLAAAALAGDYLLPMAERVFGDAAASVQTRNAATLARWIVKGRQQEVHVRHLQRNVRLPGLTEAEVIHEACKALLEAGWLGAPPPGGRDGRARVAYGVRPELWEALDELA